MFIHFIVLLMLYYGVSVL